MKKPIFILGCPRSGTTLLAQLLKPTSYYSTVESHFINKYFKQLEKYGNLRKRENFKRLLKDILKERPVLQWKLAINIDQLFDAMEDINYKKIVDKICSIRAEKNGFEVWGDKTPHYTLDLDIICELFPDSKYLYIVRDGRDVALSLLNEPWGPNSIVSCAQYWKRYDISNSDVYRKLLDEHQVYFLKYEDLLSDSNRLTKEVYDFLGEQYNEDAIDKLTSKIKRSNFNKWKSIMKNRQVKIFEGITANTLKQFGYEATYEESPINILTILFYKLHDAFFRVKHLFILNVIDTIKIKLFRKEPFSE